MTASATPMPVAYGCIFVTPLARRARRARRRCDRDQCDAWGGVMRGGVCRRVKMWNFSVARRGAFACKCVSAAGSELTVARRRRKESLPPLAMLQTRAAASRGPKPVGPALCWKHVQATGGHAVRFLKLSSTKPREQSSLTIVEMSSRKHSGAANFGGRLPPDVGRRPRGKQPSRLRTDPETCARAEPRPLIFSTRTSSQKFGSHTHKETPIPHASTRYRTQRTATHHAKRHREPRQPDTKAAPAN